MIETLVKIAGTLVEVIGIAFILGIYIPGAALFFGFFLIAIIETIGGWGAARALLPLVAFASICLSSVLYVFFVKKNMPLEKRRSQTNL